VIRKASNLPLPPFGRLFDPVPRSGVRVAIGPGAWKVGQRHRHPIMVLPTDRKPSEFRWPSDGKPALIHEHGQYDDTLLRVMASALLNAGAPSVVAIREALLSDDPRVFFDPKDADCG